MRKLIVVLVAVGILMSVNIGLAMTQDQLDKQRERAENKINRAEHVTYTDLLENENYYKDKTVAVTGICYYYKDGVALLNGGEDGKTIAIKIMTYQYKVDTEYTVVGRFGAIMPTKEGGKWAVIIEDTHLPYLSEYGL